MSWSCGIRLPVPRGLVVERLAGADGDLVVLTWEQPTVELDGLTAAESDVLKRVVRGASNAEIARDRRTSPRTIANQVASLLRKTGAASRFDLIRRFTGYREGG